MSTPGAVALVCGKWEMPFFIPLVSEDDVPERSRSYAHFVTTRQDLVAAKCLATRWLLQGWGAGGHAVEFFGGVGLVSVIIQNVCKPGAHTVFEIDERCVAQLQALLGGTPGAVAGLRDARVAMAEFDTPEGALVSLDFPHFSVLDLRPGKRWAAQFRAVLARRPAAVALTDTTCSYFHVHRAHYGEFFGVELATPQDYVRAFSGWLYREFGYTIRRAARRGRNAFYLLCRPGPGDTEFAAFELGASAAGFRWLRGGPAAAGPQADLFRG